MQQEVMSYCHKGRAAAECYSLLACRNKVNTGTGQWTVDKLGDPVFPFLYGNKF